MQLSGVFSGSLFKSRPFSDVHPPSSRQNVGKQGTEIGCQIGRVSRQF